MESSTEEKHTFLITGASSGLGLEIALEALRNGHQVIGTARNISKAAYQYPELTQAGGQWLQLDLVAPDTQHVVQEAVEREGVDILVSNAGYGIYGALEDMRYALFQGIRNQLSIGYRLT